MWVQSHFFRAGKLNWDLKEFKVDLKISNNRKRKAALSNEDASCSNVYGDANCQHTGSSCDYTLDACTALSNQQHFRGHPRARVAGEVVTITSRSKVKVTAPSSYRTTTAGGSGDNNVDLNFDLTDYSKVEPFGGNIETGSATMGGGSSGGSPPTTDI